MLYPTKSLPQKDSTQSGRACAAQYKVAAARAGKAAANTGTRGHFCVQGVIARAQISKPGGAHNMRHCFATRLLENGVDLHTIQRLRLSSNGHDVSLSAFDLAAGQSARGFVANARWESGHAKFAGLIVLEKNPTDSSRIWWAHDHRVRIETAVMGP